MKHLFTCLLLCGLSILAVPLAAQTPFRIMSYNVENFFDTEDDPKTEDNDFLPEGNHHWTPKRYRHKLNQISKVILAAGGWETLALVGLCEVENDKVVNDLLHRTALRGAGYCYCLAEHPDRRGMRVALLYQPTLFEMIDQRSHSIRFTRKPHKSTREILHVSGRILTGDTLDVFVCHFPSRYGGEKQSEQLRIDAATTLRELADSVAAVRTRPLLLAMGDFNDTPEDPSLSRHLTAGCLRNLFARLERRPVGGTHKYQGKWSMLDQMFSNLTADEGSLRLLPESPSIFAPSFLLTPDKTQLGERPFRTYNGFRYEGGYSDHLPILIEFTLWVTEPRI